MIWYLLYPFRGTTEAPVLAPTHPFRSAFTRYGRHIANHVVVTLLISVAVAGALLYPIPYLYSSDFTTSASSLPHHVWTDAQPLESSHAVEPDVIMRSIWVHGSYMKALEPEVLLGALELQNELLGSTKDFNPRRQISPDLPPENLVLDLPPSQRDAYHIINGLTEQSWFFHSPLQYWSGDYERIAQDPDIITTVNEKKTQPTSVNVTLRHSVVFSGKRFEERSLVAADALVVTLIHLRDSPVGRRWEIKARELAATMADKWTAYPSDGHSMSSQLYEFQFLPMSFQDSAILTIAYTLSIVYFLLSLSKLRAIKSKPGLTLTVLCQIFTSIMSSFTVCAILKIDLSRIPQAAYPLVVLSMSLENMFRLINAVIVTPSEDSTSSRIGQAFGQTVHVALGGLVQNLLILWGLSKVTTPGISAFCAFCAIAIIFDFFYLSTFFLSVLSVEVRRTELSEALEKSTSRHNGLPALAGSRPFSLETILQGKMAISTRIAGMMVLLGFVLVAQWHFFDNEGIDKTLRRIFLFQRHAGEAAAKSSLLVDVHQARSPTSWLRLQDHETAREVINVVKPWAHSYVARVYDPLVFVMKGSDRMPQVTERSLLPAVYDFANHQWKPLVFFIIMLVAAIRGLMQYLLWDEVGVEDNGPDGGGGDDDSLLPVKTLSRGHALDIAMMVASRDGLVVSVGLDRLIRVWDLSTGFRSHLIMDPRNPTDVPFPVLNLVVDEDSTWLAILTQSAVRLWNLEEQKWGPSITIDLHGQRVESFCFGPARKDDRTSLVIVRRDGSMVECWPATSESLDLRICKTPLVCAVPIVSSAGSILESGPEEILTLSRKGCVHRVTPQGGDEWVSEEVSIMSDPDDLRAHAFIPIPALSLVMLAYSRSVALLDATTLKVVRAFQTEQIQPNTIRYYHSSLRQTSKGRKGLSFFTLVYTGLESGDCIMQTYLPINEGETICRCESVETAGKLCCPWSEAREVIKRVEDPGTWEALPAGCVIGVRRKNNKKVALEAEAGQSGLRHRGRARDAADNADSDSWEVWAASHHHDAEEDVTIRDLDKDSVDVDGVRTARALMFSDLGPVVKVGTNTLAVAFGDLIKVITVRHSRFPQGVGVDDSTDFVGRSIRRRIHHTPSKKTALSLSLGG